MIKFIVNYLKKKRLAYLISYLEWFKTTEFNEGLFTNRIFNMPYVTSISSSYGYNSSMTIIMDDGYEIYSRCDFYKNDGSYYQIARKIIKRIIERESLHRQLRRTKP